MLVREGSAMEGHADNIGPCVHGGAVVVAGTDVLPLGTPPIEVIACVAPSALSTEVARRVLPSEVSFVDAARNAGRAALLAASLALGDPAHLLAATEDALHQPSRFALAPDSGRLVATLRREGFAAFLAGAGPSVGVLAAAGDAGAASDAAARLAGDGWEVRRAALDPAGAAVVESAQERA
jgi:homoserine kinase